MKYKAGMRFKDDQNNTAKIIEVDPDGKGFVVGFCGNTLDFDFRYFVSNFEFIPANDLEFCAVKCSRWAAHDYKYIVKSAIGSCGYFYSNDKEDEGYTREQWQECRYELGLDERPHGIEYSRDWRVHGEGGEDNKLKLTKGDIGEKFKLSGGEVVEMVYSNGFEFVFEVELINQRAKGRPTELLITNEYGRCEDCIDNSMDIVKHQDPLEWMEKLPDAEFMRSVGVVRVESDNKGRWLALTSFGDEILLKGNVMPTLTGDQWKHSKCKIVDGEWVHCG